MFGKDKGRVRWLVRAITSTSFFFTSTVMIDTYNCRSTLITVDRHLQVSIDSYKCRSTVISAYNCRNVELSTGLHRCNVQRWRSLNECKICVSNIINISIC